MKTNQPQKNNHTDWKHVRLGELYAITSSKRVFQNEWTDEGVPFYRAREVVKLSENGFVENDLFISRNMFEEYKAKYGVPQKNDLLITGVGTVGMVYRVVDNREFYFKDGNIIWLKSKGLASSAFIEQLYKSPITKNKLLGSSPITTVATYTIDAAKKAVVHLPPLTEQNRIVSVLETWDKAIEKLSKKIEAKKQIKKGLMQNLLTGKKRLKGFSEKWSTESLGDLEDSGKIKLGRGEVISKIDIENDPGHNPIYSSSVQKNGLFGKYAKYMFDEELISWSVDGGGHFFYRPKHKFSITNVSGWMRVDIKIFNYKFLASLLQLSHSRKYFDYQFKAHPSVIRDEYIITYPNIEEQKAIAQILTTADGEIQELEKKLQIIRDQKKYLLNNLITGTVRTPETLPAKPIK